MKLLSLLLLLLLLTTPTIAFTVSPAKFDTTEQGAQEFLFTLRGEEASTVSLAFEGELAPYATGPETILLPEDKVRVLVNPPKLSEGTHSLDVVFKTQSEGGQVSARAELSPRINYNIPYETAYIDYTLGIQDGREPIDVTLMLHNIGTKETTVTPTFAIEGLGTYLGQDVYLAPGATVRTTTSLPEDIVATGEYTLLLSLDTDADAKTKTETTTIFLGQPKLHITDVQAYGIPGRIIPIDVDLTTVWNGPVLATITATVTGEKTEWVLQPHDFLLNQTGRITLFWESLDAEYGMYDLTLETAWGTQTTTFLFSDNPPEQERSSPVYWVLLLLLVVFLFTIYLLFKNK